MIEQVEAVIVAGLEHTFPAKMGLEKLVFGKAETDKEVEEKFSKLKIFYDEAMPSVGWQTYTEINLKYEEQIVCKTKPNAE